MKKSDSITHLAEALVAALAEMPVIGFDSTNPFLKNKYASLGAVISATKPVLAKHGLCMVQLPISQNGTTKSVAPENTGSEREPVLEMTTRERAGTVDIGIETIILHSSGEWIAGEIFVQITKEKGKSTAQVSGSIISYIRRYAWSSALGIYADEDTDGTGERENDAGGSGGFDSARPPQHTGPRSSPATGAKPEPKPTTPAAPATPPEPAALAELRKRLGDNLPAFVWYLRNYDSGNGTPVLPPPKQFRDIPLDWAKFFLDSWQDLGGKMDAFLLMNPLPEDKKSVEGPRDKEPANGDDWRTYKLPFGEHKDTPLADLDKKYLWGFWANFEVKSEYQGRARTPEQIALDTKLRKMLDAAGEHYKFEKKSK